MTKNGTQNGTDAEALATLKGLRATQARLHAERERIDQQIRDLAPAIAFYESDIGAVQSDAAQLRESDEQSENKTDVLLDLVRDIGPEGARSGEIIRRAREAGLDMSEAGIRSTLSHKAKDGGPLVKVGRDYVHQDWRQEG